MAVSAPGKKKFANSNLNALFDSQGEPAKSLHGPAVRSAALVKPVSKPKGLVPLGKAAPASAVARKGAAWNQLAEKAKEKREDARKDELTSPQWAIVDLSDLDKSDLREDGHGGHDQDQDNDGSAAGGSVAEEEPRSWSPTKEGTEGGSTGEDQDDFEVDVRAESTSPPDHSRDTVLEEVPRSRVTAPPPADAPPPAPSSYTVPEGMPPSPPPAPPSSTASRGSVPSEAPPLPPKASGGGGRGGLKSWADQVSDDEDAWPQDSPWGPPPSASNGVPQRSSTPPLAREEAHGPVSAHPKRAPLGPPPNMQPPRPPPAGRTPQSAADQSTNWRADAERRSPPPDQARPPPPTPLPVPASLGPSQKSSSSRTQARPTGPPPPIPPPAAPVHHPPQANLDYEAPVSAVHYSDAPRSHYPGEPLPRERMPRHEESHWQKGSVPHAQMYLGGQGIHPTAAARTHSPPQGNGPPSPRSSSSVYSGGAGARSSAPTHPGDARGCWGAAVALSPAFAPKKPPSRAMMEDFENSGWKEKKLWSPAEVEEDRAGNRYLRTVPSGTLGPRPGLSASMGGGLVSHGIARTLGNPQQPPPAAPNNFQAAQAILEALGTPQPHAGASLGPDLEEASDGGSEPSRPPKPRRSKLKPGSLEALDPESSSGDESTSSAEVPEFAVLDMTVPRTALVINVSHVLKRLNGSCSLTQLSKSMKSFKEKTGYTLEAFLRGNPMTFKLEGRIVYLVDRDGEKWKPPEGGLNGGYGGAGHSAKGRGKGEAKGDRGPKRRAEKGGSKGEGYGYSWKGGGVQSSWGEYADDGGDSNHWHGSSDHYGQNASNGQWSSSGWSSWKAGWDRY